ncbi:hypothetical protein [Xanthomonas euvesicatoria]|uniref:hypothetical protein n=1 Tax=Xanthomonas euvesicatoria TaxID=456327 RepID=UPI001821D586|nr:hypothetical protein [Xanthomonas euvesicatoria]
MRGFANIESGEEVLVNYFLTEGAVEALNKAFWLGLPGWIYWIATPLALSQPVKRVGRDSYKNSQKWDNLLLLKNFFTDSCRPSITAAFTPE